MSFSTFKLFLSLLLVFIFCHTLHAQTPPSQAAGYALVFSDDFNSLNLSPNGTGNYNWYDGVWFYHNAAPSTNISAANSVLNLVWQNTQGGTDTSIETAAFGNSNYRAWRYGYFEASMRWDVVTGAWPAFWLTPIETLLGTDYYNGVQEQGELDIFEGQGAQPTSFFGTVHDWVSGKSTANSNNTWRLPAGTDFSQYHKYGVLWTPGKVTWYFDDQPLMSAPTPGVMDKQHYMMIIGMQEGANWQYGNLTGVTASSMQMNVDWVRVWQVGPSANAQSLTTAFNTPLPITLSGSDPAGLALTYSVVNQPAHGQLTGSGANLTYTPASGYYGTDSFAFAVNNGSVSSAPATVSITVNAPAIIPPSISLSPGSLTFSPISSQSLSPQTLTVTNTGGSVLNWSAISSSWLTVTPANGTLSSGASQAVQVSANLASLTAGSYSGSITISDSNASNSPQNIPVALTVIAPANALQFIPVTPCRIADTRWPNGAFGGPEIPAAGQRDFLLPNGACGIPSTAAAYSLNITVVPDSLIGFLSVWPTGQSRPLVSTLNSDGRVKANAAIVPAGNNGGVSIYSSHSTHVIVDVNGYFVPAGTAGALAFYPVAACRLADTRFTTGPYITGGTTRGFAMSGASSCNVPSSARAYSLNFTAIPHSTLRFLAAWPSGQSQPPTSTLNTALNSVTANAAVVPAGVGGSIAVYASDDTDLAIDINGYFAPAGSGGLSLYAIAPCRALDTRFVLNPTAVSGQQSINIGGGTCNLPATAQAYVLNATVVPTGILGFLALWPDGVTQPVVSTLNADPTVVTSNMAIVSTTNGAIDTYASQPTHLILDVSSYFAP